MKRGLLEKQSRVERLRSIVERIKRGESLSAFDLAVIYDTSINVVYRDIKALRGEGYIPKDWQFARKER